MAAARRRCGGSPADPPRIGVTSGFKKKKEKKSNAAGRRVASTLRDLCVRRGAAVTTVFTLFFSAQGCNYRKPAEGSELGPSVYLFPEVRKCWCIFRSQLSTAKAQHGAPKTLSENTTVIFVQQHCNTTRNGKNSSKIENLSLIYLYKL